MRGLINALKTDETPIRGQKVADVINYSKENGGADRPGHKGARGFKNNGRGGGQVLPKSDANGNSITYKEYDLNPYKKGENKGSQRVILGSYGSSYYTAHHYRAFFNVIYLK